MFFRVSSRIASREIQRLRIELDIRSLVFAAMGGVLFQNLEERLMATDNTYRLTHLPTMKTQMLIRKPVREVFEAFVDPAITTKFWFTRSSGRLEPGANIQWEWEIYYVSAKVRVKEVEQNRRIVMEWGDKEKGFTTVEGVSRPGKATQPSSRSPRRGSAVMATRLSRMQSVQWADLALSWLRRRRFLSITSS